MGKGGIYGGWTHAGRHRIWVRVPAELKERAEQANGDAPQHAIEHGRLLSTTLAAQAEALSRPYWGRFSLNGAGEGLDPVPIVLVHGIATSSRGMEPLLRELGSRHATFAPDLPGFGRSDPRPRALDLTGLAEELRRWLLDNRLAPAVLVGVSFGSQVAIELASRHPAVVDRLVLVGPTDPALRAKRSYALRWAISAPRLAPTAFRNLLEAGPWQAKRALAQAREDPIAEKLAGIEAPTLIVRGGRDRVAPEPWTAELAERIPNARVHTLKRSGHMPANGAAPRLAAAIDEFLAEEHEPTAGTAQDESPLGRWIVDGMNAIGSRPDGWWRDRKRAWRRLAGQLEQLARRTDDDVRLVLDGARPGDWRDSDLVECSFAKGGPDAADDAIVARVKADPSPETLTVVTSDRELADRVRELGAEVMPSSRFLGRLGD